MFANIVVGSLERGVLFKDKQFVRVLGPGRHFVAWFFGYSVEVFDISKSVELSGPLARLLMNAGPTALSTELVRVATSAREVAVVYVDGKARQILSPGEARLFWKGLNEISVRTFDIAREAQLDSETIKDLSALATAGEVLTVRVPEQNMGLLLESGVISRELTPGLYAFWRAQRDLSVSVVDTRLTALEVSGQEMLTKDKVSLRVNLSVSFRVVNPVQAVRALAEVSGEVYRTAQLALRQAVGEKTLDELLESKEALNRALSAEIASSLSAFGVEVSRVGVKDVVLPGDMRTLLNQVVEAEKAAQAQNIRRREETAATRSLLNTAKMMENNPILLRLKELESIEKISEKVEKLTVFDGLNGMMNGLVSLSK